MCVGYKSNGLLKASTRVALLVTRSKERRTISRPGHLCIVVDREEAVAEQEPKVPSYVREKVLKNKIQSVGLFYLLNFPSYR